LLLADAEVLEEALGLLAVSGFCSARPGIADVAWS
jgi:hypothetical protein